MKLFPYQAISIYLLYSLLYPQHNSHPLALHFVPISHTLLLLLMLLLSSSLCFVGFQPNHFMLFQVIFFSVEPTLSCCMLLLSFFASSSSFVVFVRLFMYNGRRGRINIYLFQLGCRWDFFLFRYSGISVIVIAITDSFYKDPSLGVTGDEHIHTNLICSNHLSCSNSHNMRTCCHAMRSTGERMFFFFNGTVCYFYCKLKKSILQKRIPQTMCKAIVLFTTKTIH